ncbi:hypothetical protein OROGR_012737 [Orobanche gracilis]
MATARRSMNLVRFGYSFPAYRVSPVSTISQLSQVSGFVGRPSGGFSPFKAACLRASLGSNGRCGFIDCGAASISRPLSTSITRTCSKSRFRSRSGRRYGRLPGDSLFSLAVAHSGTVLLWCWYFYGDVEVYTSLEVFTEQVAQIKSTLKYLQNFLKVVHMTLLDLTELLVEVHEQHAKDIANLKTEIASLNAEIKQLKKDT